MKMMIALFLAAGIATASWADAPKKVYPVPPDKMAEFNAKTGGMVDPPAGGRKLVVFDARIKDASPLTNLTHAAENMLALSCEVRKLSLKEDDDPVKVAMGLKKGDVGAVVLFCERDGVPTMSTFPEDAVSVVNLKPFQHPEYNTYRRRLVKEFWRAVGFAIGGYGNQVMLGSVMQPAYSVADLDAIKGVSLSPMGIASIVLTKNALKLYRTKAVPYTRACREGWAPKPVNEVQKKIYERYNNPSARFNQDIRPTLKPAK